MKSLIFKNRRLFIWVSGGSVILLLALLISQKLFKQPKSEFISPLAPQNYSFQEKNNSSDANLKSISYYITTSQEILTKARNLAEITSKIFPSLNSSPQASFSPENLLNSLVTNPEVTPLPRQQTPEEKQKIIQLINQALDIINQGISFYPHDDRVFAQRASIYQALTPFLPQAKDLAIQDLKEAIRINNQNPLYHRQLANLYLIAGDFEGAALSFYNAYLLTPTDIQNLYDLADALEKSGQLTKAAYYFEKLINLLPITDQNLISLKTRWQALQDLIAKTKLQYLSEPGEPIPNASSKQKEIIGTQELPLEQAALASSLVIANTTEVKSSLVNGEALINAKVGEGILPAGEKEVTIYNNNVASNRQILLSPLSDLKNQVIFVSAKKDGSWFKVGVDKVVNYDIKFKWWILELDEKGN